MEIEKLANRRKLISSKVQSLLRFAEAAQLDPDNKFVAFDIRVADLPTLVDQFEKTHYEIADQVGAEHFDEQQELQTQFDDLQYSIKTIHRELEANRSPPILSQTDGNSVVGSPHAGINHSKVKLPRIAIPKYDGNYKEWTSFYDLFRTLIHENVSLSNIERFQYLTSCLSKEPLSIIKGLPLTADNYTIAYEQLIDRYQNKRLLLTSYWQAIQNASKVSSDSASALRSLLSTFSENSLAIEQFKHDMWDFTLFNLLLHKLDSATRKRFEIELHNIEIPSFENLYSFVSKHCKALETNLIVSGQSGTPTVQKVTVVRQSPVVARPTKESLSFVTTAKNTVASCISCKDSHSVFKCDRFLTLEPLDRYKFAKNSNLCFNCLGNTHSVGKCSSKINCRVCGKKHHTLLHFPTSATVADRELNVEETLKPDTSSKVAVLTSTVPNQSVVLLSTVLLHVQDAWGNYQTCRALLDNGSQASFMTQACMNSLGLKSSSSSISIHGLNQMSSASYGVTSCSLRPFQKANPTFVVDTIIVPTIAGSMPSAPISNHYEHLQGLTLADPYFGRPRGVDLLLGADIYSSVVLSGIKRGKIGEPTAINTIFGWVLVGKTDCQSNVAINSFCTSLSTPLDIVLRKFWEIEHVPQTSTLSPEDIRCENIFLETHKRMDNGRFVVSLPFRDSSIELGDSYSTALRRFELLEKRLLKDTDLYMEYSNFMKDYSESGHMSLLCEPLVTSSTGYYIPHHCVLKLDSTTTKLRVVFDASSKSSNGKSLNDVLLTGPKLQQDLSGILLRFRLHKFVVTADIKQMYRQIDIVEQHRLYQRILWRFSKTDPIQTYQLNTVTYGVSSSPYLAIRVLLQLAMDNQTDYPLASQVLASDTYIDDVVTGCESLDVALETQRQLISLLSSAGFVLRKWAANYPELLATFPPEELQPLSFDETDLVTLKVLGLQWCPKKDCFQYRVDTSSRPCTKRTILSDIAKVFDPLGLLTPVTFLIKHLMQHLWSLGLGWDEVPPQDIVDCWSAYKLQMPCLATLALPRRILVDNMVSVELHGFCDASEAGYAAAIYIRCISQNGSISVSLVYAKSKVAPLKRISVPRLELCAAVLLSDSLEYVLSIYQSFISLDQVHAWSDSTVALSWIKSSPHHWKTFVSNRISHIQDKVPPNLWHHISGKEHPADCGSRGLLPSDLLCHSIWWSGPAFHSTPVSYPSFDLPDTDSILESEERKIVLAHTVSLDWINGLLSRFSSLRKIQGIVAYCLRFVKNSQCEVNERETGALTARELYSALCVIVKAIQKETFANEIECIKNGKVCSKPIQKLAPFLDAQHVLRVGGRLRHSELPYDAKHPMMLPRKHRLTELVIESMHRISLHPGPQTLAYLIAQQFWILSARRAIAHVLSSCIRCFRVSPTSVLPIMGDLPSPRISQLKPFSHAGVDFAGPFTIMAGRVRGAKRTKAYVCLFVCMSTKALHIELVSDLTSEAFLAAFRRFVARRGRCSELYSDRGTNFVGAARLLTSFAAEVANSLSVRWHFNPPSSPHFGGLWERGVRSVKSHLARVIGEQVHLSALDVQLSAVRRTADSFNPS